MWQGSAGYQPPEVMVLLALCLSRPQQTTGLGRRKRRGSANDHQQRCRRETAKWIEQWLAVRWLAVRQVAAKSQRLKRFPDRAPRQDSAPMGSVDSMNSPSQLPCWRVVVRLHPALPAQSGAHTSGTSLSSPIAFGSEFSGLTGIQGMEWTRQSWWHQKQFWSDRLMDHLIISQGPW